MKISCNIIRDILPLYAEDMVCEETREFVDGHLRECDSCTQELARLKKKEAIPVSVDTAPMEHIRKSIRKRQILTTVCVLLTVASLLLLGTVFMTTSLYLPAEQAIEGVELREDGGLAIDYAHGWIMHASGQLGDEDRLVYAVSTRYQWLKGRKWDKQLKNMTQEELDAKIKKMYDISEVTQKDYNRFYSIVTMYHFHSEDGWVLNDYQKDISKLPCEEEKTWSQMPHDYDLWYLGADGKPEKLLWQGGDGEIPPEEEMAQYRDKFDVGVVTVVVGGLALTVIAAAAAWLLRNSKWQKLSFGIAVYFASLFVYFLLVTNGNFTLSLESRLGGWSHYALESTALLTSTVLLWRYRHDVSKKETF